MRQHCCALLHCCCCHEVTSPKLETMKKQANSSEKQQQQQQQHSGSTAAATRNPTAEQQNHGNYISLLRMALNTLAGMTRETRCCSSRCFATTAVLLLDFSQGLSHTAAKSQCDQEGSIFFTVRSIFLAPNSPRPWGSLESR